MNPSLPKPTHASIDSEPLHTDSAMREYGKLCRIEALEEAITLLKKVSDGYGVTDRGLSNEEYTRMKWTAMEHCVHISRLKAKE